MVKLKRAGFSGRRSRLTIGYGAILAFLSIMCLSMLYPFVNLLFQSVSPATDIIASNGLMLYPRHFQLDAYVYLMQYPYLKESYQNTIFITLVGTLMCMLMTTLGGYVLSRKDLPGRDWLTTFVVITMFVSGCMITSYLNLRSMQLLNTRWSVIFPVMISTWNMLLMRNFIIGIPVDITEAARIDGVTEIRLIISIVLPLSKPILATLTLFYGVGRWNEYAHVIIYNNRADMQTLQVIIRKMYESAQIDMEETITPPLAAIRAATVIFSTVPILCVYPFLQKYFAQGLMVGSVKG